jgi:polyisoprenoid-binding protein YceI
LTVTGRFAAVAGTLTLDERQPANARVDATVAVASVDTGNARRDRHLLAADFLDAARHPTARFTGDRLEALDPARGRGRLRGTLTVRGVTRDVALDLAFDPAQASGDRERLHVTASTEVNRRDFGLSWNHLLVGLTDAVTISLEIEARRV